MIKFPDKFFWGAATSSHQVEGGNDKNDWWYWEQNTPEVENSQDACRHYQSYESDFDIAVELKHNAHRLSIEWSRIEPLKGQFDLAEIEHYRQVLIALKKRGIEPIVTLHHFTSPLWMAQEGGWAHKRSIYYFSLYVQKIVSELAPYVKYWITINEPCVYIYNVHILPIWPPQEKSASKAKKVFDNFAQAHIEAYKIIKMLYQDKGLDSSYVSISKSLQAFVATGLNPYHKLRAKFRDYIYNFRLLNYLKRKGTLDFLGINYYTVEFSPAPGKRFRDLKKNFLGWSIFPEGLFCLLLRLKRYNLPVIITENGIATNDDQQRWDFIKAHLKSVHRAIEQGVNIAGYLHWSLLDNFEWDKGFAPCFGLVEVDYQTYQRRIKESARKFAEVCKTGKLENGY